MVESLIILMLAGFLYILPYLLFFVYVILYLVYSLIKIIIEKLTEMY